MTMKQPSSRPITIELGPKFESNVGDVGRIRKGQVNWFGMGEMTDFIFGLEIPLEVLGVSSHSSPDDGSSYSPSSVLSCNPCDDVTVQGISPDSVLCGMLLGGGEIGMNIDSLSRSVVLTDVNERTFIEALQNRINIGDEGLEALKRSLLVPVFDEALDDVAAARAQQLLSENIHRHELNHVNRLIRPETALWREFELYWRSILVGISQRLPPDSLTRLATVYTTPSHFIVELLAMLAEDYTIGNPPVQQAVKEAVTAQRGVVGEVMKFIEDHDIDPDAFRKTLRSPTGEQYCDLWLAYVLDKLRSGYSLSEITPAEFHDEYDTAPASYGDLVRDTETRTEFVEHIRDICFGPAFESIRLKFPDERFVLERAWISLNPDASDAEQRLSVRRALFRRVFLPTFGTESGLNHILSTRETAVERVICGVSLDEVPLFDVGLPSPERLSESLATAHESSVDALLGSQASVEDLQDWLNNPEYGGQAQRG
jgi:hypothetical protein